MSQSARSTAFTPVPPRLPTPYRAEDHIVAHRLQVLEGALDWAHAARSAEPWVQAVRENPPPFWAMESLLKEYPISSAEGLALMRLAEALLRVPDAETAIALTTDQLGRADFEASGDKVLSRLSSTAIALSKHFLPDAQNEPGMMAKLGARTVVAATLRAVQLLGRQFVLGQTMPEAMKEADVSRKKANVRFSYDMLGEGARTAADALRYQASYENAIAAIAQGADPARHPAQNDGISIKLSALHPRYEDAQHQRVMAELVPRVWALCEQAAQARINLTIDAEEVDRLELSLDVFQARGAQVGGELAQSGRFVFITLAHHHQARREIGEQLVARIEQHVVGIEVQSRQRVGAHVDARVAFANRQGVARGQRHLPGRQRRQGPVAVGQQQARVQAQGPGAGGLADVELRQIGGGFARASGVAPGGLVGGPFEPFVHLAAEGGAAGDRPGDRQAIGAQRELLGDGRAAAVVLDVVVDADAIAVAGRDQVADGVAAGDHGVVLGLAGGEGRVRQQAKGGDGDGPAHGVLPVSRDGRHCRSCGRAIQAGPAA